MTESETKYKYEQVGKSFLEAAMLRHMICQSELEIENCPAGEVYVLEFLLDMQK
jgi:hypothetical protein